MAYTADDLAAARSPQRFQAALLDALGGFSSPSSLGIDVTEAQLGKHSDYFRAELLARVRAAASAGSNGTTTNDAAAAGKVGEHVSAIVASGDAVTLTTATAANVASISLTPGDYDVSGHVTILGTGVTTTAQAAGIGATSATLPTDGSEAYGALQLTTTTANQSLSLSRKRISLAVITTIYLVARCTFTAGTAKAFGSITARRVR